MNIFVIIAIVGWTIWSFACKVAASSIHPFAIQIANYLIGFLCIPIFYLFVKNSHTTINTSGVVWAIVAGVSGLVAYASFTYALKDGAVGTTMALCSTYPALTFLLSVLFLGETITGLKIAGVITTLLGLALLAY